jgi:hypothetical protein
MLKDKNYNDNQKYYTEQVQVLRRSLQNMKEKLARREDIKLKKVCEVFKKKKLITCYHENMIALS